MNEKQQNLLAIGATALIIVLSVLANAFREVALLNALNLVFSPLALIAAIVSGYIIFKDKLTMSGKGIWAVLAIAFALALKNVASLALVAFLPQLDAVKVLACLLFVAGHGAIVAGLLCEKCKKFMPFSFCILAVAALLGASNVVFSILQALSYACFAFILFLPESPRNLLIRRIGVVLTVLAFPALGVVATVAWILFAFILVPAEKLQFSFAKFTAILCVLVALASLAGYFISKPTSAIEDHQESIEATHTQITENNERLPTLKADLMTYETDLQAAQTSLTTEKAALSKAEEELKKADTALATAKSNLSSVCYRSYYSSWWCDSECSPLHSAVSNCTTTQSACSKAVSDCQYKVSQLESTVSNLQYNINSTKENIAQTEQNIVRLEEQVVDLNAQLAVDYLILVISFVALVLCLYALVGFAGCLYQGKELKAALIPCAAMALGALLFALLGALNSYLWSTVPALYIITSPYVWTVAIAGFFAAVCANKGGKPAKFRVFAIIAALLVSGLSVSSGVSAIFFGLFAIAMICVALALVPPVFTEYNTIGKHIFYSLISMGIWQLIWTYHVTKNLNKVAATENRKPGLELALCCLLPFYYSFWLLKTAENVEAYGAEKGKQFKLDICCLVFAFLCPLVSTVLIQNKINAIVGKPE